MKEYTFSCVTLTIQHKRKHFPLPVGYRYSGSLILVIALFSLSGQLAILFLLFYFFTFFTFFILFSHFRPIFGPFSRKSAKTPGKQSFFAHQEKSSILWSRQKSLHFPFCLYTFFTFFIWLRILFLLFYFFTFFTFFI